MKQISKEKWVEQTLESLAGSQRPDAPADLFAKAMHRAAIGKAKIIRMPAAQIWSAAACALVLVVANLFMCLDFSHSGRNGSSKEMFVKEYFETSNAPQF